VAAPAASALALPLPEATPTFVAPVAWQAIDFISDLHLAAATPKSFAAWAAHLRHSRADAVFILGDLFEVWVGDDLGGAGFEGRCVEVLRDAATRRTIGFMAGNRDFLVGDALLAANGVMRLADPTRVDAFGQRTLLSHGDVLCLGDTSYQRYRRIVRRPAVRSAFLALPLSWRRALGRAARRRSEAMHPTRERRPVDVDEAAAVAWLDAVEASVLVHGHTHAPASHRMTGGKLRHVLTDWDLEAAQPGRAEVLRWTATGFARIAPEGAPAAAPP
jgi:UDP-2,3-diacylglucosamine hydrolase